MKPENEWGKIECEPIVPESLWNQVNQIIEEQSKGWKRPGKTPVQLFSGLAVCVCGNKMYVRAKSPKYYCRKCCNKVGMKDLEVIVHQELKGFFAQPQKIAEHLKEATQNLSEKETLLVAHEKEIHKVRDEMTRTHRLYLDGGITTQGFGQFYKPAEERLNQLAAELPRLQAEVDLLKVNNLSADDILHEANTLYDRWPAMPFEDKRKIAESLIEKIVIGESEIDITFSYLPSSEEVCKNQQRLGLGVRCRIPRRGMGLRKKLLLSRPFLQRHSGASSGLPLSFGPSSSRNGTAVAAHSFGGRIGRGGTAEAALQHLAC